MSTCELCPHGEVMGAPCPACGGLAGPAEPGAPAPAQGGVSQGPPDTRSPEEVREWNRVWKAGYDAANRDAGHPTLTELRQQLAAVTAENAELKKRVAVAERTAQDFCGATVEQFQAVEQARDAAIAERDAAIEDTQDYLQMAKEKDAAIQRAEQLRADLAQARSALEAARSVIVDAYNLMQAHPAPEHFVLRLQLTNAIEQIDNAVPPPQGETTEAP